ncbi:Required for meiotic nuclear division protein 1 [Paragonimus heterotremus]|uniref:Required for meiotic nuclear division protein 1 n=1 Tax=Paragonimus heterotremus TaxID=100268 RepID=A0A8J4WJC8_9TREM|nr:Required for meiotic nuclear division protein 1 [Paragonimus heterotremus]
MIIVSSNLEMWLRNSEEFFNRIPICLRAVRHGRPVTTLLGQLDRGCLVACASHRLFRYSTGQTSESTSRKGLQSERVSAVLNKMKLTESSLDLGVPLTTGHLGKKRVDKSLVNTDAVGFLNVSAYGIAQYVDLDALRADLCSLDAYQCASLPSELSMEVVLISSKYAPTSNNQRDVFIFRNGVVVFWNMSESEHRLFLTRIRPFCQELLTDSLIEREDLRYCFSDTRTRLIGEDLYLQTHESRTRTNQVQSNDTQTDDVQKLSHPLSESDFSSNFTTRDGSVRGSNDNADSSNATASRWPRLIPVDDPIRLEQFAFSDALSLSVKLSLLENRFDTVAVQMEPWITKMKTGLGINFPQSRVLKKTGELFTLRHLLNISTSMIDTPDFYWDRPEVEALYNQLRSALSVSARTRVLNSKLNMCCELTEILSNHLQSRHSSRLEWMIIALILVEVAFEAFYYYERRLERHLPVGDTAIPT